MVNGVFINRFQICYQATWQKYFSPISFFKITKKRIRTDFIFGLTDVHERHHVPAVTLEHQRGDHNQAKEGRFHLHGQI